MTAEEFGRRQMTDVDGCPISAGMIPVEKNRQNRASFFNRLDR